MDNSDGLKVKYNVYKVSDGSKVHDCFVLRPDKDPAAVTALQAYAGATGNKALAADIYGWVGKPENKPLTLEHVDCKTCQFEDRDPDEEPCRHCKGAYPSRYARKPEQEGKK